MNLKNAIEFIQVLITCSFNVGFVSESFSFIAGLRRSRSKSRNGKHGVAERSLIYYRYLVCKVLA